VVEKNPLTCKTVLKFLDSEIWITGILAGLSLVWVKIIPLALIVMLLFWVMRKFSTQNFTQRTIADLSIGLVFLISTISLVAGMQLKESFIQVARLLISIGLFYTIVNWIKTKKRHRIILFCLVSGCAILAIASPMLIHWEDGILIIPLDIYHHLPLATSDPVNANVMAGTFILFLPVLISILWFARTELSLIERIIYIFALVSITIALLLTQSRGAVIAALLSIILLIGFRYRGVIWFGIIFLSVVTILGFLFSWRSTTAVFANGTSFQDISDRIEVWSRAIYMINDFGLTGVGMGSFGFVADAVYPFETFTTGTMEHAHNMYLQIAVDLGIPGLISWLATLFLVLWSNWVVFKRQSKLGNEWDSSLGAGLFSSQVALICHGLVDAVHWGGVRSAILVWIFWGFSLALYNFNVDGSK
jgi:putative inorganic carbon (hco3(-)) transporter